MSANDIEKLTDIELLQRVLCNEKGCHYVPSSPDSTLGFANGTLGKLPINGLRHLPSGNTNGWYVWCGEELSQEPDFFVPLHTRHLIAQCPEVMRFLGLPPGSRFLIAGDHVDVWFDKSLLNT